MIFKDYLFGFADANKEYGRNPEIFERAFFDQGEITDKLLNGYQFLLIGRKGVGKSAYCSKIKLLAKKDDSTTCVTPINLNEFEFSTFGKLGSDSDVTGTQKYKTAWDFLLLLTLYRYMYSDMEITENETINCSVVNTLDTFSYRFFDGTNIYAY